MPDHTFPRPAGPASPACTCRPARCTPRWSEGRTGRLGPSHWALHTGDQPRWSDDRITTNRDSRVQTRAASAAHASTTVIADALRKCVSAPSPPATPQCIPFASTRRLTPGPRRASAQAA